MDSDQGKLFIGGISWETTEEKLAEYFGGYGEVSKVVIMRDKLTGRPRGFGFIVFAEPDILDRVLADVHTIDGRTVEAKRALSREEHTSARGIPNTGRAVGGGGGGGNVRTKKIFVGGLPPTLSEDEFRQYFSTFGNVTDVVVMYDQSTNRPRGFGFISFDNEDAVDNVLQKTFHDLKGKLVEVKRALPKELNPNSGGNRSVGGGNYQNYGSSGASTGSYDGRSDTNRFMQPQTAGGGYPPYGSSAYGYGGANNGVGYGGYGVGGYGNAAAGYTGPTGAYGNPNPPAAGYASGPAGTPRSPWNNQGPSGYGSAGYGAGAGYGTAANWNAPAGSGATAAPTAQSPSGNAGYGNQAYGYGGYGGTDGSYGNQGGYAAAGGRGGSGPPSNPAAGTEQGAPSGYTGGSYADINGSSGYPNAWRSDQSQGGSYGAPQINGPPGGPASYGGGYGGSQPRQVQQQ